LGLASSIGTGMPASATSIPSTLGAPRRLPAQPTIAALVIEQLTAAKSERGGHGGSADLGAWVELDPALTVAVLAAANLPQFHLCGRVANLVQAGVTLGSQMVEAIATGRVATLVLGPDDPGGPPRYWSRALAVAIASRVVARHLGANADDAYAAGMVHDVGDLVLYRSSPIRWREAHQGATARTLLDRERDAFGRTHTELGAAVLRDWFLPDRLCRAVREHHAQPEALNSTLGRSVWAGVRLGERAAQLAPKGALASAAVLRIVGVQQPVDRIEAEIERDLSSALSRIDRARGGLVSAGGRP
jgi:putative nucleotidyltransferase with HDIG domain